MSIYLPLVWVGQGFWLALGLSHEITVKLLAQKVTLNWVWWWASVVPGPGEGGDGGIRSSWRPVSVRLPWAT